MIGDEASDRMSNILPRYASRRRCLPTPHFDTYRALPVHPAWRYRRGHGQGIGRAFVLTAMQSSATIYTIDHSDLI